MTKTYQGCLDWVTRGLLHVVQVGVGGLVGLSSQLWVIYWAMVV